MLLGRKTTNSFNLRAEEAASLSAAHFSTMLLNVIYTVNITFCHRHITDVPATVRHFLIDELHFHLKILLQFDNEGRTHVVDKSWWF